MIIHASGLPDPVADARFYEGVAPRRALAFIIDTLAIAALSIVVTIGFGVLTLGVGFLVAGPAALATAFLYRAMSLTAWSATPGMRLLGIELRRFDGARFGAVEACGHTALFLLAFALVLPQLASIAALAFTTPARMLHDLPFGAAAIHSPA